MFSKCEQMADAGAKIIQLRAKKEDSPTRRNIAFNLLPLFKKRPDVLFIINDDIGLAAEICSIIPNAGLHIGQDDGAPEDARREIGENRALGLSTHSEEQAAAADAMSGILDYFAVGPLYATGTKPGARARRARARAQSRGVEPNPAVVLHRRRQPGGLPAPSAKRAAGA